MNILFYIYDELIFKKTVQSTLRTMYKGSFSLFLNSAKITEL